MHSMTLLPVQRYRVYDAWEKETLLETRDFAEAEAALAEWRQKRSHNEIEMLALLSA